MEVWKSVLNHPGYEISSLCRIRSRRPINGIGPFVDEWRYLKSYDCNGYRRVNLDGKRIGVHVLMLEAFVGPCPSGMECRHLNDDKADNKLENLAWGTPKENKQDAIRNGLIRCGERHHKAKLTWKSVREIRRLRSLGFSATKLSRQYGVTLQQIMYIVKGEGWKE